MTDEAPFWERKTLAEMTPEEWESLCDGCAKCCLHVFEDEDGAGFMRVPVACRLLDTDSCRCTDYPNRRQRVPSCVVLTPDTVSDYPWLPETCAYRRLAEGKSLPSWHHLVCGDRDRIHEVGASVSGNVISELDADPLDALAALLSDDSDYSQ